MLIRNISVKNYFKICGAVSPYLAVVLGVFYFKNGFLAILLYHLLLLICIIGINRAKAFKLIKSGFNWHIGPVICLSSLLPGVLIFFLWPFAKLESVDLAQVMESVNLTNTSFAIFALYACFVNPFLEESFWRGCFKPGSWIPSYIDALFAGYHAILLIPVVRSIFVLLAFMALMCVGWIFRNIYRLTSGLAISLLTHIVADIAILYAVWKIMQ
jgi:membrane protease YdiL (CAAX protease family)